MSLKTGISKKQILGFVAAVIILVGMFLIPPQRHCLSPQETLSVFFLP